MYFDSLQGWLKWQETLHPRTIDLGLSRAKQVFKALNKQGSQPPTITIGGTNGKGSTVAFLEAIYRAQGYRVGSYTSPHILEYNERIKIDSRPVSDDVICAAFERIEAVREGVSLSYFEFGTLAALDIFNAAELDIQLLEVGLGGRLDAVNIIDADVAVISSVCIDHSEWLGATREAIGYEKAGIFRHNVPAVIGDAEPPQSLIQYAQDQNTPLWRFGEEFGYHKHANSWQWFAPGFEMQDLPVPLLKGEHQYNNASTALAAVSLLHERLPVSSQALYDGIAKATLSGRFQFVAGDIPIFLDVAHNPQAVLSLRDYIAAEFPGKRIHAVFSMMRDKDILGVIEIMKPIIFQWYVSPLKNSRAATHAVLRELFQQSEIDNVSFDGADFSATLTSARQEAKKEDIILVFGSFFLVSEFLETRASTC